MANLISHEWKHTLETTPEKSVTSLVSLYDLIYDSDGNKWVDSSDLATAGTSLGHDIICLNKNMLNSSGSIDTETQTTLQSSIWYTYGIDISLPRYDKRANQKTIPFTENLITSSDQSKGDTTGTQLFTNKEYYIYDKDSALAPETINIFTNLGVRRNQTSLSSDPQWTTYVAPSIGISSDYANSSTSDIYLSNEDTGFQSTLVTQSGFYAYNKIFLNPNTAYFAILITRILGLTGSLFNITDTSYANVSPSNISVIDNDSASSVDTPHTVADLIKAKGYKETDDLNAWATLLKNTFVWVRCPFYGDYIIPESFNQDLNQDSKVVHGEIMLSGAGDFNKYDEYLSDLSDSSQDSVQTLLDSTTDTTKSEHTQPYLPVTSPTVDFYTSSFLDKYLSTIHESNTQGNFSSKISNVVGSDEPIDALIEAQISGNNPIVKGLPIAPINRTKSVTVSANAENLLPPNYFDPESRKTDLDYAKMGKFPSVLPVDGNIYADGRIISPTIDEIWFMLKKLVGGRPSDVIETTDSSYLANSTDNSKATELDIGIPFGSGTNYQNDTDTTMTEVPDSEFNFSYGNSDDINKHGDPVGYSYTASTTADSVNNNKLVIDKFINQNNAIVYPVFGSLKSISERVVKFDTSTTTERQICNFTAWNSIDESTTSVSDKETVVEGVWAPRKVPYSLRELEALIMGNKYNLITFSRFVKENFSVVGKLGKAVTSTTDDQSNNCAGSLYQFHKNYNYTVDNPNTFYNQNGTYTGLDTSGNSVGACSVIDDDDSRTDTEKSSYALRYHIDYGTSKAINENQNKFSSSDNYMAADGTWRYLGDHVRIPILRCDY